METQMSQLIEQILSANNESRQGAERTMKENRQNNAEAFLTQFVEFINQAGSQEDSTKQN